MKGDGRDEISSPALEVDAAAEEAPKASSPFTFNDASRASFDSGQQRDARASSFVTEDASSSEEDAPNLLAAFTASLCLASALGKTL